MRIRKLSLAASFETRKPVADLSRSPGFELAAAALTPHAVNRVVFLSDGVGNIGETHQERLLAKVATFRERGIYLNTVGVGMGNHNDEFLEQLADHGDGLCQYVDSAREAKKVLVDEFTKTLQPIARDVKIQVDFAPALVASYRQLGYENRAIADELFRDDAVDAGEVNAGHQVTALYEVVRTGAAPHSPQAALPFATVRVRYKPTFPVDHGVTGAGARAEAERAEEITASIRPSDLAPSFAAASDGYRRSVLVAQFAELLRRSVNARGDSLDRLVAETKKLAGQLDDPEVTEFLGLVETALPRLREIEAADRDELAVLVDELCRQHYEDGSRLALGEELPEEEGAERERTAARLEERIREMVQERYAVRRR